MLTPSQIMSLQFVTRWHTRSCARNQSVAEHSCCVALLALSLAPEGLLLAQEVADLVQLALVHDAHETVYGDVPYPAKRLLEEEGLDLDSHCRKHFWGGDDPYADVTPRVRALLEAADLLEAALYAQRFLPEIAAEVVAQAKAVAATHLDSSGISRVFAALSADPLAAMVPKR